MVYTTARPSTILPGNKSNSNDCIKYKDIELFKVRDPEDKSNHILVMKIRLRLMKGRRNKGAPSVFPWVCRGFWCWYSLYIARYSYFTSEMITWPSVQYCIFWRLHLPMMHSRVNGFDFTWKVSHWNGNRQSWRSRYFEVTSVWKMELSPLIQIHCSIEQLLSKPSVLAGLLGSGSLFTFTISGGDVAMPSIISLVIPFYLYIC